MAKMSHDSPKDVMAVLIQAGDFVVTRDWARLHHLPPDLMMVRVVASSISMMQLTVSFRSWSFLYYSAGQV